MDTLSADQGGLVCSTSGSTDGTFYFLVSWQPFWLYFNVLGVSLGWMAGWGLV